MAIPMDARSEGVKKICVAEARDIKLLHYLDLLTKSLFVFKNINTKYALVLTQTHGLSDYATVDCVRYFYPDVITH